MNFCWNTMEKLEQKIKRSVCISKRAFMLKMLPIMPALWFTFNSTYYANNYAGIFDAGLALFIQKYCK